MKRQLFFLLTLISAVSLIASPKFEAGKRYHIVCQEFTQGCVTDGRTADKNTPVYYLTRATKNDETYWIFTKELGFLYSIKNAKTGQYITYDGVRSDSPELRRYINMTDAMDGDNSLWYFGQMDNGNYVIRNYAHQDHLWDVRTGSYCVGTYSNTGNGNQNQQFYFVDEDGNRVKEAQANDTGNGFDVSSWLEATTESDEGWSFMGDIWSDPGHGYYYNDNAYVITPFLERWHPTGWGPLSDGSLYQVMKNLPTGKYTISADVIAVRQGNNASSYGRPAEGVYLYANEGMTACSTGSERPISYEVEIEVTSDDEGMIETGIKLEEDNTANWVACDNFYLLYHGTEEEMIEGEKEKIRRELAEYLEPSEIEAMINSADDDFYKLEEVRHKAKNMSSDPLAKALQNLNIDGRALVYAESIDQYLCTIPLENFGQQYNARIDYTPRNGWGNLTIGATQVAPGTEYRFSAVRAGRTYKLSVTNENGSKIEKSVTFTSLPVVRITGSFNNDYSQGSIAVHEPDKGAPETMDMKAKWRGGITNGGGKHKRNYHVKLLDENGEKTERKFFGLRSDNSWILESCQVDMSRIRNRVLTDLWNDYCAAPYYIEQEPKARSGSRGRFVELILNDEYRGIYCMTENMDRKQMKLKKYDEETNTVHGQLWKSKDWSYGVFMGHDPDNAYYPKRHPSTYYAWSESWENYNVKYPDFDDYGYNTDWSVLYDAVDFVCTSSNSKFTSQFSEYFDLPVVIDYYILMETILSTDNHGKNMFFACYDKQQDKKITLGVWDMDATSGQRWSDDYWHQAFLGPEQDYARFITGYEHGDYNLFKRLRDTDAEDFNMQVRLRYRDLRENWLATESILNRFRSQLDEFKTCGAAQREYDKWSYDSDVAGRQLDFDNEMEYLEDWFTRRMNYLDNIRFKIGELPSAISDINMTSHTNSDVYNLRGQKVGTANDLDKLPAGIYVANGQKITIAR